MQNPSMPATRSSSWAKVEQSVPWDPEPAQVYVVDRANSRAEQQAWSATMPVDFDSLAPSHPFSEPLPGMALREVEEPAIFRLFFER